MIKQLLNLVSANYNPYINFQVILLATTWSKSPDSYHAITPARVDICPLIVSVEEKQSAQEFQLFFSSVNMEGNQTRFNECSDSDIKTHSLSDHHWLFYHVYARFNCEKN